MTVTLDHILLGVPDLDAGSAAFAALTGVEPVTGGSHPGFGTRNRLVSLAPDVFLELIAPDPAQAAVSMGAGSRAAQVAALPRAAVLTFAGQTTDMPAARRDAAAATLTSDEPVPMSRTRPDGVRLDWTVCHFARPGFEDVVPFAIDWQGSPHPAGTTPTGCRVRSFTALHPDPVGLRRIYDALGLGVAVQGGMHNGFVLVLDTPKGEVCFTG